MVPWTGQSLQGLRRCSKVLQDCAKCCVLLSLLKTLLTWQYQFINVSSCSCSITWGLAALKPCHQLAVNANQSSSPERRAGTPTGSNRPSSNQTGMNKAHPTTPVPVDNPSRKPLYGICTTATVARANKGDVLSMDLSPKEDGQPVIMVTLSHNESVLLRAALPCASIAALQMYPFVTVLVS